MSENAKPAAPNNGALRRKLRNLIQRIISTDKAIHSRIKQQFPKLVQFVDSSMERLLSIVSHGAFALIVALVLVVLVSTEKISLINAVCIGGAWGVSMLWAARAPTLLKLAVGTRLLSLALIGAVLAFGFRALGIWALPTPAFRVGPEQVLVGTSPISLIAYNDKGADIEHVTFEVECFVAEISEGDPLNTVEFFRYDTLSNIPLIPEQLDFPQDSNYPFNFPAMIVLGPYNNINQLQILMSPEEGVQKLPGIRITTRYERHIDHKQFTNVAAYEVSSNDGWKTPYMISTGHALYGLSDEILEITDIKQFLSDKSKWQDALFSVTINGSTAHGIVTNGKHAKPHRSQ